MGVLLEPPDPGLLRRLDAARLYCKRRRQTTRLRRSLEREAGATLEIEGYHRYGPGDDLRFLDWPSYLRLGQLLVREFHKERTEQLDLLIDTSRSMAVPAEDGKFAFAVNLAALLAYVALSEGDSVRVVAISEPPSARAEPGPRASPLYRARAGFGAVRSFLSGLRAAGETALTDGVRRYLERREVRGGTAVIISDFLLPHAEIAATLRLLGAAGCKVVAIQVMGARERRFPPRPGWYRVRDAETGQQRLVWVSRGRARLELEQASRHAQDTEDLLRTHRALCLRAPAEQGAGPFVLAALPALGIVR